MSKNLIKLMCGLFLFFLSIIGTVYYVNYSCRNGHPNCDLKIFSFFTLMLFLGIISSIVILPTKKTKLNCIPITLFLGISLLLYFSWLPDIIRKAHTLIGTINLIGFIGILFLQIFYAVKNSVLGSFLTFVLLAVAILVYSSFY